jgi:hypothetical protein
MAVFMTRKTFQKRSWQYVGDINNMNMFERQVSSIIMTPNVFIYCMANYTLTYSVLNYH